ncbi:MAG: DUF4330 domain-containing protein [Ruminococcaceae bacterium]|nr:DUF4330 domain-containing protein [Oscillospiraceae bacterium]
MRENQKKIKWKLNLFDIILIAVVLVAAGAFAAIKLGSSPSPVDPVEGTPVQTPQSVRYVVQLEQVLPQTAELVEEGQHLYERTKKEDMGVIETVEVTAARTLTKNELDGTFHFVEVPDRMDVTMTLSSPATFSDSAIVLASGLEVRAGSSVRVLGPGYYGSGYVLQVERG